MKADIPLEICNDMLNFYNENIMNINKQIIVVGHSFGGYLAQLFALSYPSKIQEVYTLSAPGVVADWSNSIINYVLPITFSPNPNNYSFIEIKQKHKDSIKLYDELIYLSKDNRELDLFIPYYLKAKSPYSSEHIDSYVQLNNSPRPEKVSMRKFARFLYGQIMMVENGQLLVCNFQTDVNASGSMTMHNENGVITTNKKYKEELIILTENLKNADKILPNPLTKNKIHSIQTHIEKIYRFNLEKNYTFFGKHILSLEYMIPINKKFEAKINASALFQKTWIDKIKSLSKSNLIRYIFVFITIEDIYKTLLVISHIDEEVFNDFEIIEFYKEILESNIFQV